MSKPDATLSEDEVRQISRIIEILNQSTFDYLQLEFGELKLTIAKGGLALPGVASASGAAAAPASLLAPVSSAPATPGPLPSAGAADTAPEEGSVAIVAPVIGRFFSQSEPGTAPYVSVGSEVEEDSTVGLIEAMKMFNAVSAGVNGVITRVCVQDTTLVEYGQVLFHVRPIRTA